ncbi:MAG: hypothetical protein JW850_06070 [Thermoflexales bacterium]|nr:hypothetical protein [Thermoflexales bacterium]
MTLWIESAYQNVIEANAAASGDAIRTFQTYEQFVAIMASAASGAPGERLADEAASALKQGARLERVKDMVLASLPGGVHSPFAILHACRGPAAAPPAHLSASLLECDAPPLFLVRGGQLVLLPLVEEESHGRLVRDCEFTLQDGDYLAMASEGYIRAKGWNRVWGWRDVALSIKRLTDTRCDAEQLLGALVRSYYRLAIGDPTKAVSVVAMAVRPMRTATVWSGPPLSRQVDPAVLEKFMAESGKRIICGDTTAEIAARLLGAEVEMEPPPEEGWAEVPPVSRLAGVDLVTEGVVTLSKARERMANAQNARDLPRQEDGATRLARLLLAVDKIHLLVGLAVNPAQTVKLPDGAGVVPMRKIVVEELMRDLAAREKVVTAEYF